MAATGELAIDLKQVSKAYRRGVFALDLKQLGVHRGEVFGLLGPNGAGKSTLVKILMTVVRPTSISGALLGHPVGHRATLARVGYLPEQHRFPRYLTGRQTVEFFGALCRVDRPARKKRAAALLETVGMSADADRKISTYSKGMMQRVGLAQALVNDPDLVLLDEPTDGVDPMGRRDIRVVLAQLRDQGKTVFINSHLLSELELICDRVAILVNGNVALQGTLDQLTVAKQRYEIEIDLPGIDVDPSAAIVSALRGQFMAGPRQGAMVSGTLSGNWKAQVTGTLLRVECLEAQAMQPLIDALRAGKLSIRRVQLVRPSLEDLFVQTMSSEAGPPPLPAAPLAGGKRGA